MPEDLQDKLIDFELMLQGFVATYGSETEADQRIKAYWYDLVVQIKKELEKNSEEK